MAAAHRGGRGHRPNTPYPRGQPLRELVIIQELPLMLYLDARQVASRLDRRTLIDALAQAFRSPYEAPQRSHHAVGDLQHPDDLLLVMPAWQAGSALGVKLVTVFPGNSLAGLAAVQAAYVLFDARTGVPSALLDGSELTRRRTAAASALAARCLARGDAARLTVVGSGGLAPHIIESHAAVRPITSVRIWGRRRLRAESVAREFAGRPYQVHAVDDLEAAVRWADIISCATLSKAPLVKGAWLRPGQHLDLIGSFTPAMREVDDEALVRARIFVDTRSGALTESGELVQGIAAGAITAASIQGELADLVRDPRSETSRKSPDEITLFKSVGCALEDLIAAQLAMAQAPPGKVLA